jgi:hypothetical protein
MNIIYVHADQISGTSERKSKTRQNFRSRESTQTFPFQTLRNFANFIKSGMVMNRTEHHV